ncbi:hypothetical protein ABT273_16115, partial [Streptomyces humidus]|uniref:hypothetical protein n=1 Tax=Streptomyces humidus TaxID=52259 RepID=UPI00332C4FDB
AAAGITATENPSGAFEVTEAPAERLGDQLVNQRAYRVHPARTPPGNSPEQPLRRRHTADEPDGQITKP